MEEIWKHAPENAVSLRYLKSTGELRFFNADDDFWDGDNWLKHSYKWWITVVENPLKQRKTLHDFLKAYPVGWPSTFSIAYARDFGDLSDESLAIFQFADANGWRPDVTLDVGVGKWVQICTREEYEQALADRPKFTHSTPNGEPCNIVTDKPDVHGLVTVVTELGTYGLHQADKLTRYNSQLAALKQTANHYANSKYDTYLNRQVAKKSFVAGAQWQKGQVQCK